MANLIRGLGGIAGFGEGILNRNDDGSTQEIDITSIFENGLNFFGNLYTTVFVNNNGSITFERSRSTFTPSVITEVSNNPEITAFFADVDTRISSVGSADPAGLTPTPGGNSTGSDLVYYDLDTVNDRLVVTWDDVGYFSSETDKLNAFQIIISDEGNGDFDIQFRYEDINWTTGNASGGSNGLGGTVARAGWTAGTGDPTEYYELEASGNQDAILNLDETVGNGSAIGLWEWHVRNGKVVVIDDEIEAPTGPKGHSVGDPHIRTFDGVAYSFMGAGEFILARDTQAGGIEVHARHEPWPNSNSVTINTAAATLLDGHRVMFDTSDTNILTVDGAVRSITDGDYISVGAGRIYKEGDLYTVIYPGDDGVVGDGDEQLIVKDRGSFIDLEIKLNEASGTFEGLLGNADGDRSNDIARSDGTIFSTPISSQDLYGDFRNDWRIVDPTESLFTYDAGESPESFFLPSFPSNIQTIDTIDPALRAAAEEAALQAGLERGTVNFNNAVLDFALTNDSNFLESADESDQLGEETQITIIDDGPNGQDDYTGDTTTSGFIQTNGYANGNIETAYDTDWFQVNLDAGTPYYFVLAGSATAGGTLLDPLINGIYNSNGALIDDTMDDDSGIGLNSYLEYTPTFSGSYFLSAAAYHTYTGTYSLTVTDEYQGGKGSAILGPDDDVIFPQFASPYIIGGGIGNDVYLISSSLLNAGREFLISDPFGNNVIQLAEGLPIASDLIASNAIQLTLQNGSSVSILDADNFTYDVGGNLTSGLDFIDLNYNNFVENILGSTVPTSNVNSGNAVNIGGYSSTAFPVSSGDDNFLVPQTASPNIIGAGAGNDTYLLSQDLFPAGRDITISDPQGSSNSIQLASGLSIVSSLVASNAIQLTLQNGSTITILDADEFSYEPAGNRSAGIDNADISFNEFVQNILGTTVPTTGVNNGGSVVIGEGDFNVIPLTPGATGTFNATSDADQFYLDVVNALASPELTQLNINGFDPSEDQLRLNLPSATGHTTLAGLDGSQGVAVQSNAISQRTLVNFGTNQNGDIVAIDLAGVVDASEIQVDVI